MVDFKALVNKAKETEDQSVATAGGADFEFVVCPAGKTVGRFIEYIELGKHVELYEGKPKPAFEMVRVTFAVTSPKMIREVEGADGTKHKIEHRLSITMPKKLNEKSKFYKLFQAMIYGRTEITHMAEMLGEAFTFNIVHNESGEGDKKKTFANLYNKSVWGISSPFAENPLTGEKQDLRDHIPQSQSELRIFLWNNPTEETWKSLFIDGEREQKDGAGNIQKISKNWLQETILSATDYQGSLLEQMLTGLGDLPTGIASSDTGAQTDASGSSAEDPAKNRVSEVPAEQQVDTSSVSNEDALASLGL